MTPACMGGMCAQRDHCARYHQLDRWDRPAERLCERGGDEMYLPLKPVRVVRAGPTKEQEHA